MLDTLRSGYDSLFGSSAVINPSEVTERRQKERLAKIEAYVKAYNSENKEIYKTSIQYNMKSIQRDLTALDILRSQLAALASLQADLNTRTNEFIRLERPEDPTLADGLHKIKERLYSELTPSRKSIEEKGMERDLKWLDDEKERLLILYDKKKEALVQLRKNTKNSLVLAFHWYRRARLLCNVPLERLISRSKIIQERGTLASLILSYIKRILFSGLVHVDRYMLRKTFEAIDQGARLEFDTRENHNNKEEHHTDNVDIIVPKHRRSGDTKSEKIGD